MTDLLVGRQIDASSPYPALFEPYTMGSLRLRNRIVMAGHGTRFVDLNTHHLVERQAHYLADRALGGVGLIVQGSAIVHPTGLATAGVNEIWSDASIPSYAMLADAVHEHGTAIFGQLSHLGRQGNTFATQRELWAPSAVADPASRTIPHAMTRSEIRELVESFRAATRRFLAAGYDGLEVYMGHGYLLCEFLSEFSNRRIDEYGGTFRNRLRLPLEVLGAVREEAGSSVPIGIRISADEFSPKGLTIDQSQEIVAAIVAEQQLEYVSVSQSNYASMETMIPDMSFRRAPYVHLAAAIREVTAGVPVMTVARLITPEACEEIIAGGQADFVCLVRPLIADPEFANKAREGRREDIRECISCNVGCRGAPQRGLPVACLVNPAVGFEAEWGVGKLRQAERARRVLVVGGGPAGLKAAETAAERGHEVVLLEASDRLGGQVLVAAAAMPYRDEFANSVRFLEGRLEKLGVEVRLETPGTAEAVAAYAPDVVVVATGSAPGRPDVPGCGLPHVFTVHDAIARELPPGSAVVLDCGEADWKSLTTAERLLAQGRAVTIVSPVPVGAELDNFSRPPLIRRLRGGGARFAEYRALVAIQPDGVVVRDVWSGEEELVAADLVVASWYGVANDALSLELDGAYDVHAIGDCLAPRRAIDAIWDGFRIGREL